MLRQSGLSEPSLFNNVISDYIFILYVLAQVFECFFSDIPEIWSASMQIHIQSDSVKGVVHAIGGDQE